DEKGIADMQPEPVVGKGRDFGVGGELRLFHRHIGSDHEQPIQHALLAAARKLADALLRAHRRGKRAGPEDRLGDGVAKLRFHGSSGTEERRSFSSLPTLAKAKSAAAAPMLESVPISVAWTICVPTYKTWPGTAVTSIVPPLVDFALKVALAEAMPVAASLTA